LAYTSYSFTEALEEYPGSRSDWHIHLILSVKPLNNILDLALIGIYMLFLQWSPWIISWISLWLAYMYYFFSEAPEECPGFHSDWYLCFTSSVKYLKNILDLTLIGIYILFLQCSPWIIPWISLRLVYIYIYIYIYLIPLVKSMKNILDLALIGIYVLLLQLSPWRISWILPEIWVPANSLVTSKNLDSTLNSQRKELTRYLHLLMTLLT
jgi:hypothetical protein